MTRKLLITAAAIAIGLTPLIGIGTAEARGGGFQGGDFHGGVIQGGGFHRGSIHRGVAHRGVIHGEGFRHRGHFGGLGFWGDGLGYGGFTGYADPDSAADASSAPAVPPPVPADLAVARPPCHEATNAGVVIERGQSCSRDAH